MSHLRLIAAIIILACAMPCLAEEPDYDEFFTSEKQATRQEINDLRQKRLDLIEQKRRLAQNRDRYERSAYINAVRSISEKIDAGNLRMAKLRKREAHSLPDIYRHDLTLKVGTIGGFNIYPLGTGEVSIVQIIDEETFLGELKIAGLGTESRYILFMAKSVSTANQAEDQTVHMKGLFIVSGTVTYETILGQQRTVFVVEPIDVETERERRVSEKKQQAPSPADDPG